MKKILKLSFLVICVASLTSCLSNNKSEENAENQAIDSAATMGAAEGGVHETHADSMAVKEVDSIVKAN
jgi:hypothetical protein